MTSNPLSSDFSYKKYSLEQLDNWVNDSLNCEDLTSEDIYNTLVKCVGESLEYHEKHLTKSAELLSLLKGNRSVNLEVTDEDWADFWEECYYPEEIKDTQEISQHYTDEELNAMCDAAEDKEKCREYNLREAEYYNKRAQLDAETEAIKAAGGYEWTPDPVVSRNDTTRLKYESGWVYESPDGGKTITKRRPGSTDKVQIKVDGYSTSEDKN